jgi:hypothetical protein
MSVLYIHLLRRIAAAIVIATKSSAATITAMVTTAGCRFSHDARAIGQAFQRWRSENQSHNGARID